MNDRFKFRGVVKLDSQNIIIYSSFLKNYDDELILSVSESEAKKQIYESGYKLTEKDKNILWGYSDLDDYYPWFNFECEIIEQCTGLKDKNGKLIYEGDICIPAKDMADKAGEVYRAESGAYFIKGIMKSGMEYDFGIYWHHYMYEVIGNIHTDKKLLDFS